MSYRNTQQNPMSNIAINAESIGKEYIIGGPKERYKTLRDSLMAFAKAPFRRLQSPSSKIWALKDVSFDIKQGEAVGIIGRNGAGKSTLLKILSRITEPTEGRVALRGRVASLLEVGTGFHPELTGRENIYLNGAILGMTRTEIKSKFDEIVSFAETDKFLDTPVKHYSSGMYVRLAFAVAAHLEPEILLVDEVLAVGDAAFQKKCLGKMGDVTKEGKTVLFVSHNMVLIREFCTRTLLLSSGALLLADSTQEAIRVYISDLSRDASITAETSTHRNRLHGMQSIIQKVWLCNAQGEPSGDFTQGEPIQLLVSYDVGNSGQMVAGCGFILESLSGSRIGGYNTYMAWPPPHRLPSRGVVAFFIKGPTLTPGRYLLTVSIGSHQNYLIDKVEKIVGFDIHALDIYGTGYLLTAEDGIAALECTAKVTDNPEAPSVTSLNPSIAHVGVSVK
jgi:lipopolysaccharide transport system ATP-binding protein